MTMSNMQSTREPETPYRPHDQQHSPIVLYQAKKRANDYRLGIGAALSHRCTLLPSTAIPVP